MKYTVFTNSVKTTKTMSKKTIFITLAIIIAFTACNTKQTAETETTSTEQSNQLYACPMHPDITGKKGDNCSKCGMELTEPVKSQAVQATILPDTTGATTTSAESDQLYACPMHVEIKGKKGDKCSKCGMDLTEPIKAK